MTEIEYKAAQRFVRFVEKDDPSIDFLVKIFQLSRRL
jgi:hypothetical protein